MVDNEGNLGDPDTKKRFKAVENHHKWIEAARMLGCHSIRVNAFGAGTRQDLKLALLDGLGRLTEFAAGERINVLIENHGLHTSDARFIVDIIEELGQPNLGTLPDFGNWCLNREWGSIKGGACTEMYDPYQGVAEFLPFAKGVSAKSYDFDENGDETSIDYKRLIALIKESAFKGYIGIEYEGDNLSETEGILATKKLLKRLWEEV